MPSHADSNRAARVRLGAAHRALIDRLPKKRRLSPARALRMTDGRLVPLVFVRVSDPRGRSTRGIRVDLIAGDGRMLDTARTAQGGLAVLRFPRRSPREANGRPRHAEGSPSSEAVRGVVKVRNGGADEPTQEVVIAADAQHTLVRFEVPTAEAAEPLPSVGDDPLSRLPVDFSPEVCADLSNARDSLGVLANGALTTRPDPLLGTASGVASALAQRAPIVRRLQVLRRDENDARFVVELRQEWVLVGYSIGELSDVSALSPGGVRQRAEQLVTTTTTSLREQARSVSSTLTQRLTDLVTEVGSIDSVVHATSELSAGAVGGGLGILIPPFALGLGGGGTWTNTESEVTTDIDTSLLTNRTLQQAATLVNQALARVESTAQGASQSLAGVSNLLAPLVSGAANLMRWHVYENYAVCTHVDAVHPVEEIPIVTDLDAFVFSAERVLAYRPFFEPALLDPTLRPRFDDLAATAATPSVDRITVAVTYSSPQLPSPLSNMSFQTRARVQLENGASGTIRLPLGVGAQTVQARIDLEPPLQPGSEVGGTFDAPPLTISVMGFTTTIDVPVQRVDMWLGTATDGPPDVTLENPGRDESFTADVALLPGAGGNALVDHVNAHPSYYLGVLAAAALRYPHLRQDAPELGDLEGTSFWELPVVGFEGTTALVMKPPEQQDAATLEQLLERDPGAGTLVQLRAKGSYGEILSGLLSLADAAELPNVLHPLLKEAGPSPFGSFPTLPTDDGGTAGSDAADGGGGLIDDTLGDGILP